MNFNFFTDQTKIRHEKDDEMLHSAFTDLVSILNADFVKRNPDEAVRGAIEEILVSLGVEIPQVPDSVEALYDRLMYMVRPSKTMLRRVELTGAWWKVSSGSLLCSTVDGDIAAVIQKGLSGYSYQDKHNNLIKINNKTAGNLKKEAFCFYKSFPQRELKFQDLLLFMLKSITVSDIVFVLIATFLVALVGMLTPYINKQLFDMVIPAGIKSNIPPITSLLVGAALGTSLFNIARSRIIRRFSNKFDVAIQSASMIRVFSLTAGFFKSQSSGGLADRLNAMNQLCTMITVTVLTTGLTAVFSLVYIVQIHQYAPSLLVPSLWIIFVTLGVSIIQSMFQLRQGRKSAQVSMKLSGLTYALFSGIQKIKLVGAEKRAFSKWSKVYSENAKILYVPPLFMRLNTALNILITAGGLLIIYYIAAKSNITSSNYMAFHAAYGSVSVAFLALVDIVSIVAKIKPVVEIVDPILSAIPESAGDKEIINTLSGRIEINNVTFRYHPEGPPLLNNISLQIKKGQFVAIVGKTGCGKSTLLRLLLGFEQPEAGTIYYDDMDLQKTDVSSVRRCIGTVLQNGKLFSGDIFSNIVVTAPYKTLDDAWKAARMAGFEDDIKAMPMGMHTIISEGGGGISGGQKQRLLITRAFITMPKILFFDEATSALDNITQKCVTDSIHDMNCTRLVIAHRLSTIQNADRIICLDGGRIVEDGNYEMLMEQKGFFYELAKRQTL